MTLLAHVTAASERVSRTASRLEKIRELAACLRDVEPDEIAIAIAYLSGETCQGKLGVSYASLQDAARAPAAAPTLALSDVDHAFSAISAINGKGASGRRTEALRTLLARATAEEQDFLARLIVGELRQGALRGIMVEAIAAAAQVPVADRWAIAAYIRALQFSQRATVDDVPADRRTELDAPAPQEAR